MAFSVYEVVRRDSKSLAWILDVYFESFLLPRSIQTSYYWDLKQGSETVGKKWICALSNLLNRFYLDPSICQILATFPRVEFLKDFIQVQKEEEKFVVGMSSSSIKRQIRKLHVVVVQWRSKNVLKNVMHVQSYWFDHFKVKPIVFFEVVVVLVVVVA